MTNKSLSTEGPGYQRRGLCHLGRPRQVAPHLPAGGERLEAAGAELASSFLSGIPSAAVTASTKTSSPEQPALRHLQAGAQQGSAGPCAFPGPPQP